MRNILIDAVATLTQWLAFQTAIVSQFLAKLLEKRGDKKHVDRKGQALVAAW
jgi:hypothetical protein